MSAEIIAANRAYGRAAPNTYPQRRNAVLWADRMAGGDTEKRDEVLAALGLSVDELKVERP